MLSIVGATKICDGGRSGAYDTGGDRRMRRNLALIAAFAGAVTAVSGASVAAAAPFYQNRTITLVVGAGDGGSYSLYARVFAPYFKKHIPGNPKIVIQYDPKDGGRHATHFVHSAAAKDGTVIAITQQNIPIFQLLRPAGIKYDVFKWNWIGNMATIREVIAVWYKAPAKTIAEAKRTEVIMGATSRSSDTYINPRLANALLGTKFKIVTGYRGAGPLFKAIEQGEVQGFAISALAFKLRAKPWIDSGKILFMAQTGLDADPDFPKVPIMWKLGKTKLDRNILKLMATSSRFGRAIWAPPGVPKDRIETLRKAFDAAIRDPEFLTEAAKRKLPIEPVSAADLAAMTRVLAATDPETINAARTALGLE